MLKQCFIIKIIFLSSAVINVNSAVTRQKQVKGKIDFEKSIRNTCNKVSLYVTFFIYLNDNKNPGTNNKPCPTRMPSIFFIFVFKIEKS